MRDGYREGLHSGLLGGPLAPTVGASAAKVAPTARAELMVVKMAGMVVPTVGAGARAELTVVLKAGNEGGLRRRVTKAVVQGVVPTVGAMEVMVVEATGVMVVAMVGGGSS